MHRALGLGLALVACLVPTSVCADGDDEARIRALVERYAERRWRHCAEESGRDIDIELLVLGPDEALASVRTDCHRELDGAYNYVSTVVHVGRGRVRIAPMARRPAWARPGASDGAEELFNVSLGRQEGAAVVSVALAFRGLGDVGWEERYRWTGRALALIELRERRGGAAYVEPGPFPILGPPERRCHAELEMVDPSPVARAARSAGRDEPGVRADGRAR